MPDENYSKREIDQHFADLFDRLDRREKSLDDRLTKQDDVLSEIKSDGKETKAQAIKTNGRVNALEPQMVDIKKELPNLQDAVNKHENWRWYMLGIGASVLILGGVIYGLTIQNVNNTIDQKISESESRIIKAINDQLKGTGSAPNFSNSVNVH